MSKIKEKAKEPKVKKTQNVKLEVSRKKAEKIVDILKMTSTEKKDIKDILSVDMWKSDCVIVERNINRLIEDFKDFEINGSKILRDSHEREDAFELLVLEQYIGKPYHGIVELDINNTAHITFLKNNWILNPDAGVDGLSYDKHKNILSVYQAKYTKNVDGKLVDDAFGPMNNSINLFLQTDNILSFLKNTDNRRYKNLFNRLEKFNIEDKKALKVDYYFVNTKNNTKIKTTKNNHILNMRELELLVCNKAIPLKKVTFDIKPDTFIKNDNQLSFIMTGYNIASTLNEYQDTKTGTNSINNSNVRDSLDEKTSNTFDDIKETILYTPEMFLYKNNGINFNCDDYVFDNDKNTLTLFSVSSSNGAQAIDTLISSFSENQEKNLKIVNVNIKVIILNDIMDTVEKNIHYVDSTKTDISREITVCLNKTNRVEDRDLMSNNVDQQYLREYSKIEYDIDILIKRRKGAIKKSAVRNDELGQMMLAVYGNPGDGRSNKTSLFSMKSSKGKELYKDIYDIENGYLIESMKSGEYAEILFMSKMFKQAASMLKKSKIREIKLFQENVKRNANSIAILNVEKSAIETCSLFYLSFYKQVLKEKLKMGIVKFDEEFLTDDLKRLDFLKILEENIIVPIVDYMLKNAVGEILTNYIRHISDDQSKLLHKGMASIVTKNNKELSRLFTNFTVVEDK